MSSTDWLSDEPAKAKSKRKAKPAAHKLDEPYDDSLDSMLDSVSKSTALAASMKSRADRRSVVEAAGGWSNDVHNDGDDGDTTNALLAQPPPVIRRGGRRPAEEIIATDIPTIPMDDADGNDAIDFNPDMAVAPEFSINQIASFKEIENEFTRERASQYIDSKIDIGILYHNLNLQEEFDAEEQKRWDWDKLFVEVRNAITSPTVDS